MKEAPEANKKEIALNLNDSKMKEDNFKLSIDYYHKDKPFKKVIIGSTTGVFCPFSASIIAIILCGLYIFGSILFYSQALLIKRYSAKEAVILLVFVVSSLLGGIGYVIYKIIKTKKPKYSVKKDILEIIKLIKDDLRNQNNNNIKYQIIKEIDDMNFYNNILIGNKGFGKNTLINEFLRLKNNIAKENSTTEHQNIENYPKKYPEDNDKIEYKINKEIKQIKGLKYIIIFKLVILINLFISSIPTHSIQFISFYFSNITLKVKGP